ncbi:MAG: DNA-processing protein DprA [Candidatus Omnitrophica bacterium]|nr:DNA-processing protein DprA [Candidatus Omnitrophota bacterium]
MRTKTEIHSREALILLNMIQELTPVMLHRLLAAFGDPLKVLRAGPAALEVVLGAGASRKVIERIGTCEGTSTLERELRLSREAGVEIITLFDAGYPELLKVIPCAPPVLYVKGTLLQEDTAAVAVVGTRAATPYGLNTARSFSYELGRCGITVVSGLAEGIDGAAHEGALRGGGRTLAVLGHGLQTVYPPVHRPLAQRIVSCGALISEFPMEAAPLQWNFPRRNRVIAGLSLGTVVVEAPPKSGALLTAKEAAELGRDVFAVPGPVTSPHSRGTHRLIKDGAKLTESIADLLEELAVPLKGKLKEWKQPAVPAAAAAGVLSEEEQAVYGAVPAGETVMVDRLAGITTLAPSKLLPVLTGLELKGLIRQVPGRGFSRLL